jgi:hypothetical protein
VEAIVAIAVAVLLILVFVGYLVALVRFIRRHPPPDPARRYSMGNSITGFWRYVLRERESTTRGKPPRK